MRGGELAEPCPLVWLGQRRVPARVVLGRPGGWGVVSTFSAAWENSALARVQQMRKRPSSISLPAKPAIFSTSTSSVDS